MAKPGRISRTQALAVEKRNTKILDMDKNGWPQEYIATYFNLSKGQVSKIIKAAKLGQPAARSK